MLKVYDLQEAAHWFKDQQALISFVNKLSELKREGPCILCHGEYVYGVLTEDLHVAIGNQ